MDDKRLQTEFDGYFEGANLPANLTADAKAQVKSHRRDIRKWFLRLAPVAVSFVLFFAVLGVFINRSSFNNDNFEAPGVSGKDEASNYYYYTIEGLTDRRIDPYSTATIKGLEFARDFAYSSNSDIKLTAFYENENIKLAKAEISLLHNGYRHDAVLYVEYTNEYYCFEELEEYLRGDKRYYRSYEYIYNENFDEGENVYMIYRYAGNVKYYLSVMTSEPYGYQLYFDFLKNI